MLSNDIKSQVDHFEIDWDITNKVPVYPTDPDYDQYDELETETSYDGNTPIENSTS